MLHEETRARRRRERMQRAYGQTMVRLANAMEAHQSESRLMLIFEQLAEEFAEAIADEGIRERHREVVNKSNRNGILMRQGV